jgi:hypothetical protein
MGKHVLNLGALRKSMEEGSALLEVIGASTSFSLFLVSNKNGFCFIFVKIICSDN